jgi:hypothetical protein
MQNKGANAQGGKFPRITLTAHSISKSIIMKAIFLELNAPFLHLKTWNEL